MPGKHKPFPKRIQEAALKRQKSKCGSCGTKISSIGKAGKADHKYGESAEGHHVIPHSLGGPLTKENCVILCQSCHYSAHGGGAYRKTKRQYEDVQNLPMAQQIKKIAKLFRYY
nr:MULTISPECIES: HNH endonuclease signature motif containing protein [unclassified Ruegeria]